MRSLLFLICSAFILTNLATAQIKKGIIIPANKLSGSPSSARLNINNVSTWIYNNGNSDVTPTGNCGFIYPKGSGKNVFFESGPIWGGSIDGYWAVGGSTYRSGLRPGRIMPDGTPEDFNLPGVRIYRVRSDYKNFTGSEGKKNLFASEVNEEGKTVDEIYAQYELDWRQWPVQYGAPYIDKDGDGLYNPDIDVPGMSEEPCQTVWFVANDLDQSLTQNLYGALPMKIEMQCTMWAFKWEAPIGNTIFRKYKIINRNSKRIDSMSICMWSDPDLGDPGEDLVGCDTTIGLGYVFNGRSTDGVYGSAVPAAGFTMIETPVVPGNPTDEAIINGKRKIGYKNLGMTGFFMITKATPGDYADPPSGVYTGALSFKNYFQGNLPRTGTPVTNYITGKPTRYMVPGDPVLKTGWYDGVQFNYSDRRFGLYSGMFSMNPNDTQQLMVAQIAAGGEPFSNNLNAVSTLKFYAKSVRYATGYDKPYKIPPVPSVNASPLDGRIILNWWEQESVARIEHDLSPVYKFQGYNIYQLPRAESPLSEGKLIATYDVIDGLSTVFGWTIDPAKGFIEFKALGFGSDSGIKRYYETTQDLINFKKPLYNFSKYYYGVTSYYAAKDQDVVPRMLESAPGVVTAIPQPENPGVRMNSLSGDIINPVHAAGTGDARIAISVVNPQKGDGKEYTIKFPSDSTYSIIKGSETIISDVPIKAFTADNPIVAGAQLTVNYPEKYVLRDAYPTNGINPWQTYPNSGWPFPGSNRALWNGGLFSGNDWYYKGNSGRFIGSSLTSKNQYHNVLIKFADTDNNGNFQPNDPNASYGYRFVQSAAMNPAKPEFAPYIKNKLDYGYQEFGSNGLPNIPLAAYDLKTGKRLAVGMLENNSFYGFVDGKYWPPKYSSSGYISDNHEVLFIYADEYSATANPNYTQNDREIFNNTKYGPLPIMYFINAYRTVDKFSFANEVTIYVNNPLTPTDKFTFIVPGTTESLDNARQDVDKVNVFPNPYYAVNPQEINPYQRFVTFTHLPNRATIKIFTVSGQLIKIIEKDDNSQIIRWNLATDNNLYIASGIYVARVDMPDIGRVKTLKLAIIVEQQYPTNF